LIKPLPEVEGVLAQGDDTPLDSLDEDDDDELEPPLESFEDELDSLDDEPDSLAAEPESLSFDEEPESLSFDEEPESFAAAPSFEALVPLVADDDDDRESVIYHPLPLNTMPTG
jgi:hypothetical protein